MRKIIDSIKNKDIDIIILITIIISGIALFMCLTPTDELWNFANAYKMFLGYEIYEDLNVIITPLFFYMAQIFFYVFGATMLGFRVYNIFITTTLIVFIYKLFLILRIKKERASIYTMFIILILTTMIRGGANYNILAFIPIVLNILLILKNRDNKIIVGILLFLTFMIKQNIFIYHAISLLIYEFISRRNIKEFVKNIFKTFFSCGIFIIIFLLYLYINNNLYNFINYCFLGVTEFGEKNIGFELCGARYIYISVIILGFILFITKNKNTKENISAEVMKNIKTLLCFGIPLILVSFPIVNYYHATLSSLILIITFIYLIDYIFIKDFFEDSKKIKKIYNCIMFVVIIYSLYTFIYMVVQTNKTDYYFNLPHPFYGTVATEEEIEDIKIICDYINKQQERGINVKILSGKANMYMVPLRRNNEIFDLPNLGNMGKHGEDGLIEQISKLKNTEILIQTNEEDIICGQESKKIREYIITKHPKTGQIQEYSIYKIN